MLAKGDRVKIVRYGHLVWQSREVDGNKTTDYYDIRRELVGKEATIVEVSECQPGYIRYSLDIDDIGKVSWFSARQLRLLDITKVKDGKD